MPRPNGMKRQASDGDGGGFSSNKKQKKGDAQKFYAVRAGFNPGVYLTWDECSGQVKGFAGAVYKSFLSRQDAEAFVAGENPNTPGLSHNSLAQSGSKLERFYAVAQGSFTGIFATWDEASGAITGWKRPKYKRFGTRAEAVKFIEQHGNPETIAKVKSGEEGEAIQVTVKEPVGAEDENEQEEDEENDTESESKSEEEDDEEKLIPVWTDGSSLANGRRGAAAGVGVFFSSGDPRNVSERLEGEPQTNQRAELTAILRALQIIPLSQGIQIFTDSQYSINCVTMWYLGWQRNSWKTANGGDVKNRDLVQAVRVLVEERNKLSTRTEFTWVKGHSTNVGNQAADKLAVMGARKEIGGK